MTDEASGQRRRITVDGEHYYLIVTRGPDGWHICATCARENAPERAATRRIVDQICEAATLSINAVEAWGV